MTGNAVIDLAISALGIAILAGLARLIFGKTVARFDAEAAAERLAFDEPDFEPAEWLIDESSGAALARNSAGDIAIVAAHGDGLVTRRVAVAGARADYRDGMLTVEPVDHTTERVCLAADGETARAWLARFRQNKRPKSQEDMEAAS